jgi:bifunctional DNase/RNase
MRLRRLIARTAWMLWLAGCSASSAPTPSQPAKVELPERNEAPPPDARASSATATGARAGVKAPPGYQRLRVAGVAVAGPGHAVVLVDEAKSLAIPIFVGGTEAMAIELRSTRRRFTRPLTHDLLDAMVHELGGEVIKVHIDDIRRNAFVGAVFVRSGKRVFEVDARPSDAIAIALGSRVPIFVAKDVVEQAGIKREELERYHRKNRRRPTPDGPEALPSGGSI